MTQKNFLLLKEKIFNSCNLDCSELTIAKEGADYGASSFYINNKKILFRTAKTTPTKVGQFVTVWKRNQDGITEPFSDQDDYDFLIVYTPKDIKLGVFIFPKSILLEKSIFSQNSTGGKRGFRLYPSWDITTNKQAQKTQQWQQDYFFNLSKSSPVECTKIKQLLS